MKRIILLLPPLALLLAGLAMALVAPLSWGAAATIGFPDSLTTIIAAVYAVPAIVIGGLSTLTVMKNSRDGFSTSLLVSPLGGLAFIVATAVEVALCFRVADSGTYAALRNASGEVTVTQSGLLVSAIAPTIVMGGFVGLFAYVYCQILTPRGTTRFDRRPDEPDMIEALMRNRDR